MVEIVAGDRSKRVSAALGSGTSSSSICPTRVLMSHARPRRAKEKPRLAWANRGDGGRYWVRTSDLLGVNEALYH